MEWIKHRQLIITKIPVYPVIPVNFLNFKPSKFQFRYASVFR